MDAILSVSYPKRRLCSAKGRGPVPWHNGQSKSDCSRHICLLRERVHCIIRLPLWQEV